MELDDNFEEKLAAAILPDDGEMKDLGEEMLDIAKSNWAAYAAANDYDIDHITDGARITDVDARPRSRSVRVEWPFSALFEFGVDPHVIEASDADQLSFGWPSPPEGTRPSDAPAWVESDSVNWGSVTGGIPKSRAIRDMLQEIRSVLRD